MALPWLGTAFAAVSLLASVDHVSAKSAVARAADSATNSSSSSSSSSPNDWRSNDCDDEDIFEVLYGASSSDTWAASGSDDAWNDVVQNWEKADKANGLTFTASVAKTLDITLDTREDTCESFATMGDCTAPIYCAHEFTKGASSPASEFVWNSFAKIGAWHSTYFNMLHAEINSSVNHLDVYWQSQPKQDTWSAFLTDVVTIGNAMTYGAFIRQNIAINWYYGRTQFKISRNIDDEVAVLLNTSQAIAYDVMTDTSKFDWTPTEGADFGSYILHQSIAAWANVTQMTLQKLFSGDDDSLALLGALIADGQLIGDHVNLPAMDGSGLRRDFQQLQFGLTVPLAWRQPGASAFVMDSGISCVDDPVSKMGAYLSNDTMRATGVCYGGKQYYLVQPQGAAKKGQFSAPLGLDWMDSNTELSRGYTKREFTAGSVKTYAANGNKNAGSIDFSDAAVLRALSNMDASTPGFVRLPVCGPTEALESWRSTKAETNPNFPCAAN